VVIYFSAVVGLLVLATALPTHWELAVDALASLMGGSWCTLNFWRCRHAHCLVTGAGWLILGVFSLVEAGIGRSLVGGDEEAAFYGILAAGILFEWLWVRGQDTHALVWTKGGGPSGQGV
jgi:hypothetical protein